MSVIELEIDSRKESEREKLNDDGYYDDDEEESKRWLHEYESLNYDQFSSLPSLDEIE